MRFEQRMGQTIINNKLLAMTRREHVYLSCASIISTILSRESSTIIKECSEVQRSFLVMHVTALIGQIRQKIVFTNRRYI